MTRGAHDNTIREDVKDKRNGNISTGSQWTKSRRDLKKTRGPNDNFPVQVITSFNMGYHEFSKVSAGDM